MKKLLNLKGVKLLDKQTQIKIHAGGFFGNCLNSETGMDNGGAWYFCLDGSIPSMGQCANGSQAFIATC